MTQAGNFKFRKQDRVGAADAEEDREFLRECFVDTGDLTVLRDCSDPRRIVVGRTGSGKSALLIRLSECEDRVIIIRPESLALAYISNSTILNFFSALGVRLDIFFKLLWRHVFTVEIIKHRFNIDSEAAKASFVEKLKSLFRDKKHQKALDYLEKWGKSFWEETEYRVKEVTTKLENDLKDAAKVKIPGLSFSYEDLEKLSREEKQEIVERAQHVVNDVQIRQLSDVIELIDDVMDDPQKRYFLVIDRLDEDWIEENLRHKLIRSLIETVKDFRKVHYVKIIVAVRFDLLHRVFRLTRDSGFQEEKYESLYLTLQWNKKDLIRVLDERINFVIKQRYTNQRLTHKDILPKKVRKSSTVDYMLDRSMMRPRDIILFFNFCIQQATDSPVIGSQMILKAEGEYSQARLRSLQDEWYADYPNLIDFCAILKARSASFRLSEISEEECERLCLELSYSGFKKEDILSEGAKSVVNSAMHAADFRRILFEVFYRTGLIGFKLEAYEPFLWSITGRRNVSPAEITDETKIAIHPCFNRVFGVREMEGN